jgi:uncharacterized protein YdhG (YjbR/CyaY superfamily)
MPSRPSRAPETVDEYLDRLPPDSRAALGRMRQLIRAAAPRAEEILSYGHPAFRQGRMRLNYAAFSDHCSLFGWARVGDQFRDELAPFVSGKATLVFGLDRELPSELIQRLVKALLALNPEPGSR